VLAMLAVLRGARRVDAVDIDPWAYRNGQENVAANGLQQQIHVEQGDASLLAGRHYDFVLANINRNILLRDLPCYIQTLSAQGKVILSGILEADIPAITTRAEELGLQFVASQLRDGWAALRFEKRA
ncbi:MAG: 50S ribosomal protein L11 methyltransferase, partial [Alistipes sp.]|nr:50S ribosomal protein L11 methyltransferase [Alistipes sp.]